MNDNVVDKKYPCDDDEDGKIPFLSAIKLQNIFSRKGGYRKKKWR